MRLMNQPVARAAGGTIHATRLALRTGAVAVHLGGGFHHAQPGAGLGFCVFNDVAVAIRRLRARGFTEPVLVVDLDQHDGNGTRQIFASFFQPVIIVRRRIECHERNEIFLLHRCLGPSE
ncbi:MAG: hypothetical protein HP494_03635 [Nitrospira sp.]|nr:hypothetical protein [Nitrospira sp.]